MFLIRDGIGAVGVHGKKNIRVAPPHLSHDGLPVPPQRGHVDFHTGAAVDGPSQPQRAREASMPGIRQTLQEGVRPSSKLRWAAARIFPRRPP